MGRPSKYSPELRERAVRMVFDHTAEHPSQWAAIRSVGEKLGMRTEVVAPLGAAGRARYRPASGPDHRRARGAEATPARNRRTETRQRDPAEGGGVFRPGGARPPSEVMVALHRSASGHLRSRADLRGAADRSVHVFPAEGAAAGSDDGGRRGRSAMTSCGRRFSASGTSTTRSTARGRCGGSCAARASAWRAARSSA